MAEEGPPAPGAGVPAWLEEAELQLALHRSLEPQGREAEREEAAALRRALALSLLEPVQAQAEEGLLAGGPAQLLVHVAFEQDLEELDQALGAALEGHLREETVGLRGHTLPAELRARLERRHGVSVALHGDGAVLRGFGPQPARAARHLAALLAGPQDQGLAFVSEASRPTRKSAPGTGSPWGEPALRDQCPMHGPDPAPRVPVPQQRPEGPAGRLECLAESDREFQTVVQAFYDTLDAVHSRIHVVRVSPRPVLSASWPPELMAPFSPCRACGRPSLPVSGFTGQELPGTGRSGCSQGDESTRLAGRSLPRGPSQSLGVEAGGVTLSTPVPSSGAWGGDATSWLLRGLLTPQTRAVLLWGPPAALRVCSTGRGLTATPPECGISA